MPGAALLTEADPPAVTVLNRGSAALPLHLRPCHNASHQPQIAGVRRAALLLHWLGPGRCRSPRLRPPVPWFTVHSRLVVDQLPPKPRQHATSSAGPGAREHRRSSHDGNGGWTSSIPPQNHRRLIGERRRSLRPTILIALHLHAGLSARPGHGISNNLSRRRFTWLFSRRTASKDVHIGANQPFRSMTKATSRSRDMAKPTGCPRADRIAQDTRDISAPAPGRTDSRALTAQRSRCRGWMRAAKARRREIPKLFRPSRSGTFDPEWIFSTGHDTDLGRHGLRRTLVAISARAAGRADLIVQSSRSTIRPATLRRC